MPYIYAQAVASSEGARWHDIPAGEVPVVLLVMDHSVIPHIAVAPSTSALNWSDVELRVFSTDGAEACGLFALPDESLHRLGIHGDLLSNDPLPGRVNWRVTRVGGR